MIQIPEISSIASNPYTWLFFLLDITIKGTALIALAFMVSAALSKVSAATRHILWLLILGSVLVLPILVNAVPAWRVPLIPMPQETDYASTLLNNRTLPIPEKAVFDSAKFKASFEPFDTPKLELEPRLDSEQGINANKLENKSTSTEDAKSRPDESKTDNKVVAEANRPKLNFYNPLAGLLEEGPSSKSAEEQKSLLGNPHWTFWIFAVWFLGAALVVARMLLGAVASYWITTTAKTEVSPEWKRLLTKLSERIGLNRKVKLMRSDRISIPKSGGIIWPLVVLPAEADEWDEERKALVLIHELAHCKRFDVLSMMISRLACALNWFNPLIWKAHLSLRNEMERACDDMVIEAGTKPSEYALHLAEMARAVQSLRPSWATVAMAHRTSIKDRLMSILNPSANRRKVNRYVVGFLSLLLVIALVPISAFQPWAKANESSSGSSHDATIAEGSQAVLVDGDNPLAFKNDDKRQEQSRERESHSEAREHPQVDQERNVERDTDNPNWSRAEKSDQRKGRQQISEKAILGLIEALSDEDVEVKRQAVRILGEVEDKRAVEALIPLLKNPDAGIRQITAWALGNIEDPKAAPALAQAVEDENAGVRHQAIWALGQIGDPSSIEIFMKVAKSSDPDIRRQAILALGQLEDARAVPILLEAMEDTVPEIRRQSVWALGELNNHEAVTGIIKALNDSDADVRKMAAWALGEIQDKRAVEALTNALKDSDAEVRKTAAWALGEIADKSAVAALSHAVKDENPEVSKTALWALGEMKSVEAVPAFIAALDSQDASVRKQAAWALGEIQDKKAVEALTKTLKDSDAEVRKQAAWALGQIADKGAVAALSQAVNDENPEVSKTALWALVEMKSVEAVPAFIAALDSQDARVKKQAAWALGEIQDKSAVEALTKVLKDSDAQVRKQAAWALGMINDNRAVDVLIQALKDSDAEVRRQAAWALGMIRDNRAEDALFNFIQDPDDRMRQSVMYALGEIGSIRAVEPLLEALKSSNDGIRASAASALGEIGDKRAIDALVELVRSDPSAEVRRVAARALSNIM